MYKRQSLQNTQKCLTRASSNKRKLTVQESEEDPRTRLTEDLGMKRATAKFVQWLLLQEQKELQQDLLDTSNNDPDFLEKVIISKIML